MNQYYNNDYSYVLSCNVLIIFKMYKNKPLLFIPKSLITPYNFSILTFWLERSMTKRQFEISQVTTRHGR